MGDITQEVDIKTKDKGDNINKAILGLNIFMKNFCINHEKTKYKRDTVFRCAECEFCTEEDICLVKAFAYNHNHKHKHNYPMHDFGSREI